MHSFPWLQEAAAICNNRKQGHVPCQAEYVCSLFKSLWEDSILLALPKEHSIFLPSAA